MVHWHVQNLEESIASILVFTGHSGLLYSKRTGMLPQDLLKSRSLDFSNRSEIWQAFRQQHCLDACQILERYDHYNIQTRGFETSRELAVRCLLASVLLSTYASYETFRPLYFWKRHFICIFSNENIVFCFKLNCCSLLAVQLAMNHH